MKLTSNDIATLQAKGITQTQLEAQLDRFVTGFPYLQINAAATPGNGILVLTPEQEKNAITRWDKFIADGGDVLKFVPASGAASRMFKALYAFVDSDESSPADGSEVDNVIKNIHKFAFFPYLNEKMLLLHGQTVDELINAGRSKEVISGIISAEGLNYGNLPKGLLKFHTYGSTGRTPLEEHLMEGLATAKNKDGVVRVHFTVSPDHREKFNELLNKILPELEKKTQTKYEVTMSEQKASTDTVAVNTDNSPFRDSSGKIVFRPGGHGALIENLNDLDATVVFVKNIDNVVPDAHREATIKYKKIIAGIAVETYDKVNEYLQILKSGKYTIEDLRGMIRFLHDVLNIRHDKMKNLDDSELALYIKSKLERPIRVCGMVRNEGEPGGGPYIARNPDGSYSPQILESTQIDLSKEENKEMMSKATHFNPVDLVCIIKDSDGNKFKLPEFVDPDTGFISSKSLHGRTLKALELPGLWNGAMSDWSTIFVEVPIETFNPVKTVNDLLRPAHQ